MASFDKARHMMELFAMDKPDHRNDDDDKKEELPAGFENLHIGSGLAINDNQHKPIQPKPEKIVVTKYYTESTQEAFLPSLPHVPEQHECKEHAWSGAGIQWTHRLTAWHYMYGEFGATCYPPGDQRNWVSKLTYTQIAYAMGYNELDMKNNRIISQVVGDAVADARQNCVHAPGQFQLPIQATFIDDAISADDFNQRYPTNGMEDRAIWEFPDGADVEWSYFREGDHGKKPGWLYLRGYQFVTAWMKDNNNKLQIRQNLYLRHHFNDTLAKVPNKKEVVELEQGRAGAVTYHPYNQVKARIATVAAIYCTREIQTATPEMKESWRVLKECILVKIY